MNGSGDNAVGNTGSKWKEKRIGKG